jgi:drug/metabolite transporter (DMT)-like permease
MGLSLPARQRVLFAFLCVVWGATWLALKIGTSTVPPALFSGVRWTAAGLVLLVWGWTRGDALPPPPRLILRLALVGMLMIGITATIQLYALRYVGSGLAAVINSALTPLSLLGFSVALGHEQFRRRQLLAILLGIAGLLMLFGPRAWGGRMDIMELWGGVGVIVACLAYCGGSVLSRPLMRVVKPAAVAAYTNLIGGLMLLVLSVAVEPGARAALALDWGLTAWASWLFLLLAGSLGASVIYFILVRDWGASRTGSYAFVSPVISVVLGVAVLNERLDATEIAGMVLMLTAAALVLRLR